MTTEPRIPPLAPSDRDEQTEGLLASLRFSDDGEDMNLFATLAHHPALLKRWSQFGGKLLFGGSLSDRDREVLILRTSANTGADYEWGHHLDLARQAGLADDQVRALADPEAATSEATAADDALLVRAADELHYDQVIGEQTWAGLAERYDEGQLIELCMVVGQYHLVAFTTRSLGIQLEPQHEGIPT